MNWERLGQVFTVEGVHSHLLSHASNPLAVYLEGDIYRVFYSGRDAHNRSSVGYVDIDVESRKVIYTHQEPLISYGPEGSFYSHGISIGNVYNSGDEHYVLFMGWQIPKGQHWRGDVGRLQLIDNKQLILNPETPFMSVDEEDKISLSYPYVVFHEGMYKMWYGSTLIWEAENGEMIHVIKYATSKDGIVWEKHGIAVPYEVGVAQAFSRPSVIIDELGYHMWFSYRDGKGTKYRIGYAFSENGKEWSLRLNETGMTVSEIGWDSEMICYPFVFEHKDKRYMLYNGNDYGKAGFGLAILTKR